MAHLKSWWVFVTAVLASALAGWFWRLRGDARRANLARAAAEERRIRERIDRQQSEVRSLSERAESNTRRIHALRQALELDRAQLTRQYEAQGLSAEEIASRFARLRLDP